MGIIKKKQCRHCRRVFIPDHRNRDRQNYCRKPKCRKASKAASQKKWLSKSENKDYFKGSVNVTRVQDWRGENKHLKPENLEDVNILQDPLQIQEAEINRENSELSAKSRLLQDSLMMQPAIIIGLISNFIGSTLQDDILKTLLSMQKSGKDILNFNPNEKEENHDCKTPNINQSSTQDSQKLQLDRSPVG